MLIIVARNLPEAANRISKPILDVRFPDRPNPMRSGAMQCAVGATSGMIFRHMYD
jgi:hypothetical protein